MEPSVLWRFEKMLAALAGWCDTQVKRIHIISLCVSCLLKNANKHTLLSFLLPK